MDMKQKMMEAEGLTEKDFEGKDRFKILEERFAKLIDMQGLTVQQIDDHQFEVFKPSFDADHPIPYVEGMELVNNAFYLKDGKVYVWMNEWVEW